MKLSLFPKTQDFLFLVVLAFTSLGASGRCLNNFSAANSAAPDTDIDPDPETKDPDFLPHTPWVPEEEPMAIPDAEPVTEPLPNQEPAPDQEPKTDEPETLPEEEEVPLDEPEIKPEPAENPAPEDDKTSLNPPATENEVIVEIPPGRRGMRLPKMSPGVKTDRFYPPYYSPGPAYPCPPCPPCPPWSPW